MAKSPRMARTTRRSTGHSPKPVSTSAIAMMTTRARVAKLPAELRPFVAVDCMLPVVTLNKLRRYAEIAQRVAAISGFTVLYQPGAIVPGDVRQPLSIFSALPPLGDNSLLYHDLDARNGDIASQLAAELDRDARTLLGIVAKLRQEVKGGAA